MTYRDDLDAAQARVASLERELQQARAELDESKSTALVPVGHTALATTGEESTAATRWLGAPTKLELTRVIDGEIPDGAHTELVECIRVAMGNVGTTTVLPGSLAWAAIANQGGMGPFANIYITYRDGKTSVRADEKTGNLAGAIFGGIGGGVGGGGIMAPIAAAWITPLLLPITIPLWLGGTYWACRRFYKKGVAKRRVKLETLVDDLADIARKHIERARLEAEQAEQAEQAEEA